MEIGKLQEGRKYDPQSQLIRGTLVVVKKQSCDNEPLQVAETPAPFIYLLTGLTETALVSYCNYHEPVFDPIPWLVIVRFIHNFEVFESDETLST